MTKPPVFYNVSVRFQRDVQGGKVHSYWPVHTHNPSEGPRICSIVCGCHHDTKYTFRQLGGVVNACYRQCGDQIYEVCIVAAPSIPGEDYDPNDTGCSQGGSSGCEASYLMCD